MATKLLPSRTILPRILQKVCGNSSNFFRVNGQKPYLLHLTNNASTETTQEESSGLRLSESCVKQLHKIGAADNYLRVVVEGGGCSGFQYKFQLDDKLEQDDKVFERDGAKVIVDETSLDLLKGSLIDYSEELIRSSFRVVDNPKAEVGCSCGVSFSIKIE